MGVIRETRALFLNFWKASLRASAEVAVRACGQMDADGRVRPRRGGLGAGWREHAQ